jgi:GNAT superfamily N-acetyltransferase
VDPELRPARVTDAPRLGVLVNDAFDVYRSFAPAGWEPPDPAEAERELRERLARSTTWCLVAEAEDRPVGYVAVQPASVATVPSDEPGLAHVWHLFVERAYWGSGLARVLLAAALDHARAGGFTAIRLATPAGQARARRFYEREGFTVQGPPFLPEDDFGLELVEYRRPL